MDGHFPTLGDAQMPVLFRAADRVSGRSQRWHLRCVSANLMAMVGAAFIATFLKGLDSIVTVLLMFGGLLLTQFTHFQKFEGNWYDGRAVAESVKTRAWRFMTASEPFRETLDDDEAAKRFNETLHSLAKGRPDLMALTGAELGTEAQITPEMWSVRALPMAGRLSLYLAQRIGDQRGWYSRKAQQSKRLGALWLVLTTVSQLLAAGAAIFLVKQDNALNAVGIFTSLSAAMVAWVQTKRYQDLANAYGLAAQELMFIAAEGEQVRTPDEFSSFVVDAENAISREHTMWIARRSGS